MASVFLRVGRLLRCRIFSRSHFTQQVLDSLNAFEKGMGTVLRNAWTHIEALQTTDVPLLVEYVTGVRKGGGREKHLTQVSCGEKSLD